jgi:putative oxidoreductase
MSMSKLEAAVLPWAPRILSVLRIITALLFFEHGLQKMVGFPPPPQPFPEPMPPMLMASGGLEFVGGIVLALGLFTRPVAFLLSGMMAVAYFIAHAGRGFFPILNGGELAIVYCFVFLYFFFAGGGAWSIDAMRARKRAP